MIRYLSYEEIDKVAWDRCIEESNDRIIYALSWYLDRMTDGRWDALVMDDYRAVFPLPVRKKMGIRYVYTPFFIQRLGIFASEDVSPAMAENILFHLPADIRLVELQTSQFPMKEEPALRMIPLNNYELSLQDSYDEIRKRYSDNHQRNLNKALKHEFLIQETSHPEALIQCFRAGKGKEIRHWKERDYQRFSALCSDGRNHAEVRIPVINNKEGELIAGAVFFIDGGRAIMIFSAAAPQAKSSGAMVSVIDYFIREHAGQDLILDFEGSENPGLARFYAGFGSVSVPYQRIVIDRLPKAVKMLRRIRR